tara:strand:- start:690 stop:875 length:186 start_codon:yes stop_codon:yes gene_type:complete
MQTNTGDRLNDIIAYQTAYHASIYDCIMAVADMDDLEPWELDEIERAYVAPRNVTLIEGKV